MWGSNDGQIGESELSASMGQMFQTLGRSLPPNLKAVADSQKETNNVLIQGKSEYQENSERQERH